MAQTNRKLEHWLKTYVEWLTPQSIAPESFIIFSGLWTLASVLKRHVKVGKEYLGGWECYPNLYICFVAPAGVSTKSTTIDRADDHLLQNVPSLHRLGGTFTTPIIADALQKSPDSSVYINGSELGLIIEKAGTGIYSVLIDLFDGRRKIEDTTISRSAVFANNPAVSAIFGTTPEWVGENITAGQLGGGFGSRVLWINETEARGFRLIHKRYMTPELQAKLQVMENELVEDLVHIGSIYGDFHMSQEVYEKLDDWAIAHHKPKSDNERKIRGYVNRRPAFVLKLAMMWHLCYDNTLELTWRDLEWAIGTLASIEKQIAETFRFVGKARYVADIEGIEKYVRDMHKAYGKVKYSTVFEEFKASADPELLKSLIQANVIMEKLEIYMEESEVLIRPMLIKI
jgi:hypothetical protein